MTQEEKRLEEPFIRKAYWRRWGPYLSERRWGTVRRLQPHGTAWTISPDHARPRLSLGEDGIAGISDNHQRLCFAIALWNGEDQFSKLFGVLARRVFGVSHRSN